MINHTHKSALFICLCMLLTAVYTAYAEEPGTSVNQPEEQQKSPILVEKKENQTQIRIDTQGPLAPYLGSSKNSPPPHDIMHLIGKEERNQHLHNIHLETGIGLNLNKNTNIDLGYRFEKAPTLMDNKEMTNGQIRFGIQLKY